MKPNVNKMVLNNSRLFTVVFGFLVALVLILLSGCQSIQTAQREDGFRQLQRSFAAFDLKPELYEKIALEITVYIVGDRSKFKWDKAAAFGSPVKGYATKKNEICVFGRYAGGKIVLNQAILGHELNHLLNFKNPAIADPDKLDDLGA